MDDEDFAKRLQSFRESRKLDVSDIKLAFDLMRDCMIESFELNSALTNIIRDLTRDAENQKKMLAETSKKFAEFDKLGDEVEEALRYYRRLKGKGGEDWGG